MEIKKIHPTVLFRTTPFYSDWNNFFTNVFKKIDVLGMVWLWPDLCLHCFWLGEFLLFSDWLKFESRSILLSYYILFCLFLQLLIFCQDGKIYSFLHYKVNCCTSPERLEGSGETTKQKGLWEFHGEKRCLLIQAIPKNCGYSRTIAEIF